MADFALWATACETVVWLRGTFNAAYCGNRDQVVENVFESDSVAVALRTFIAKRDDWEGTATELLAELGNEAPEPQKRSKEWPASAKALSGRLRRAATFLRKVGVEIVFARKGHERARAIQISLTPESSEEPSSAPSASCNAPSKVNSDNGFSTDPARTIVKNAEDSEDRPKMDDTASVRSNPLKSEEETGADDLDAKLPQQSAPEEIDVLPWKARL